MNPTGLRSKAKDLHDLPKGLYTVQEAHLTTHAIPAFKQELTWQKTGYTITHGKPAPPRSNALSSVGGRHTGVAVLSAFPCRQLHHHWTAAEFDTGRCLVAAAHIQNHWITVGTVYGFNEHRQSLEVQQNTDSLLSKLTSRVLHGASGLRIMTGDWNLERSQLVQADEWESKGWVEAQQLARLRWNRPIQCTCKRTSVKDYIYLSPEVVQFVTDVELNWSLFPDHAVVIVHLADFNAPPKLPIWRKPSKFGWPSHLPDLPWDQCAVPHHDPDVWYHRIWKNAEQYAQQVHEAHGLVVCSNQLGRATTAEVHWTNAQVAPVKPNRRGDVQSTLGTSSLQHSRWTKQVRRLQHLSRCLGDKPAQPTLVEHRANLWHKIRTAPGFSGGFCLWWADLPKQFIDTPDVLPVQIPTLELAMAIFSEFLAHYRQLERNLSSAKLDHAIQRRAQDPNLIFKDVQREPAEPVQTLIVQHAIKVNQIKQEGVDSILELAHPLPQAIDSLTINAVPVQVAFRSQTELVVPNASVSTDASVVAEKIEGDAVAIIQMFNKEWAPRWLKPDHDQPDKWHTITNFMKAAVPSRSFEFPAITLEEWRKETRKKKRTAAVGPDGVSREDLLRVPDAVIRDILAMIEAVEKGAAWPSQAVTGMIAALAKVPSARTTSQYRPITIFSLVYRIWSSIRAKQCLKFLLSIVPATQLGNMPSRSPKHMWYHIQEVIEHAHATDLEVAGCVIDIVKCFNALPRQPLLDIAAHIGIPPCVLKPWEKALAMFQRRFQVRGCTGEALHSNCGFPEGCGLSTVAMAICNLTSDVWMYHRNPSIQCWNYVDNIETLTDSAHEACDSEELLTQFCELMDLEVDTSKSYCWSNTAAGRKTIRDFAHNSKLYARDLGGHMSYGRLRTNRTITQKMDTLQQFWHRAARSCAPASQKQRAILTAAWPNLFYGISTVTIGNCHFERLRTLAAKALGATQAGVNPMLHLSCVCTPKVDPEFYCLFHTVMSFRDCHAPDLAQHTIQATMEGHCTSQGPCSSLLLSLFKIAWSWESQGQWKDQNLDAVDLVTIPKRQLEDRLRAAWQTRVMAILEDVRKTMKGARDADVQLTQECLTSLPNDHQGLMRCALNGTQFTNDALAHANVVMDPTCKFCDHKDSPFHRHWQCSFFEDVRQQFPDLANLEHTEERCLLNHGWLPRSNHLLPFQRELDKIPDTTKEFFFPTEVQPMVFHDLFLDGSCLTPNDRYLRVATWGVVVWTGKGFEPLASGGVPGRSQTSLRGEIMAAIAAVSFASTSRKPCRLWVDNSQVVQVLHALMTDQDLDVSAKKDADLWIRLQCQWRVSRPHVSQVFKVQAHTDPHAQETPLDTWATCGNDAADQCAAAARANLPAAMWTARAALRDDLLKWRKLGRQLHSMFVAIAVKAQQAKAMPETNIIHPVGPAHPAEPEADSALQRLAHMSVADLPAKYQISAAEPVLRWLRHVCPPGKPAQWVSFHQLLLHFQQFTHHVGPACEGKTWSSQQPDLYEHRQQVQWFVRYLQNACKDACQPLTVQQRRPPSHVLTFWSGHVAVCLSSNDLLNLDSFLQKHVDRLPARQIKRDMANVPPGWTP